MQGHELRASGAYQERSDQAASLPVPIIQQATFFASHHPRCPPSHPPGLCALAAARLLPGSKEDALALDLSLAGRQLLDETAPMISSTSTSKTLTRGHDTAKKVSSSDASSSKSSSATATSVQGQAAATASSGAKKAEANTNFNVDKVIIIWWSRGLPPQGLGRDRNRIIRKAEGKGASCRTNSAAYRPVGGAAPCATLR